MKSLEVFLEESHSLSSSKICKMSVKVFGLELFAVLKICQ